MTIEHLLFLPVLGTMMWVGIGSAVLGAGTALYGANKQSKDNAHALDVNQQQQDKQNNVQWINYLMSRGVQPTGPVATGVVPGPGQSRAINAKLPLWATIAVPKQSAAGAAPAGPRWQKSSGRSGMLTR